MSEGTFPDVRWGRDPGRLVRRSVTAVIGSRFGAWCFRKLTPVDHKLLSRSNGRFTIFGPVGVPLLLLTTTGRKSGQRRQAPVTYMREGDRLFLVGSNFGRARHPAWSSNLLADPNAWVTMGGREIPVVATQLTGPERERIFGKFADYASNYDAYRGRTDREFRLFELTKRL
jgi:deazaflavin-dependent oxidoreductase (nitroreductase family)